MNENQNQERKYTIPLKYPHLPEFLRGIANLYETGVYDLHISQPTNFESLHFDLHLKEVFRDMRVFPTKQELENLLSECGFPKERQLIENWRGINTWRMNLTPHVINGRLIPDVSMSLSGVIKNEEHRK